MNTPACIIVEMCKSHGQERNPRHFQVCPPPRSKRTRRFLAGAVRHLKTGKLLRLPPGWRRHVPKGTEMRTVLVHAEQSRVHPCSPSSPDASWRPDPSHQGSEAYRLGFRGSIRTSELP